MAKSIMLRALGTREKVLILILALLLIIGCYYFLVVKNVADTAVANEAQLEELDLQISSQMAVIAAQQKMVVDLEKLGPTEALPEVAVYDNVRNELNELNAVLANAITYNINFSQPMLEGSLVRRSVALTYTVPTTTEALNMLKTLQKGKYACEITDFSLTNDLLADGSVKSVSATSTIVYFETTTGAKDKSGLTEDKTAAKK